MRPVRPVSVAGSLARGGAVRRPSTVHASSRLTARPVLARSIKKPADLMVGVHAACGLAKASVASPKSLPDQSRDFVEIAKAREQIHLERGHWWRVLADHDWIADEPDYRMELIRAIRFAMPDFSDPNTANELPLVRLAASVVRRASHDATVREVAPARWLVWWKQPSRTDRRPRIWAADVRVPAPIVDTSEVYRIVSVFRGQVVSGHKLSVDAVADRLLRMARESGTMMAQRELSWVGVGPGKSVIRLESERASVVSIAANELIDLVRRERDVTFREEE